MAGVDDDLYATATVIVMARFDPNDVVYVRVDIEGHGSDGGAAGSKVHSNSNKAIHFLGHKIK